MAGGLSVKVGGDISGFQSAMTRASDLAKRHALDIATNFQGAATKINVAFAGIESLSKLPGQLNGAKAAALGFAATGAGIVASYALVSSAISQANEQLDRFIKLGSNAERAGVGVEFFQRFSEAAAKAKIDVADIEVALKRAGSVVIPKFEQEDTLRARLNQIFETGYTGAFQSKGLEAYNAAGTNEQRIRAAVTAMQELRDLGLQTAAIEIGDKLFGPEVAARIQSGRLDIDAIAASLDRQRDDLISQEQVAQAAEFRERLDAAYQTIDEFLHVSVALEGSGRAVLDVWLMIAEGVAKATVNAGNFYTKIQEMQGPLANYLSTVAAIVSGTGKIIAGNLNDQATGARTIYAQPIGPERPGAPANAITNPPMPPRRALELFTSPPKTGGGAKASAPKGASASESLDAVQTYINGIERSTAALKAEMDALGKSNVERQVAINLAKAEELAKQAGITLSAEQTRRIRETSVATVEYKDRIDDVKEKQEALRSIGGSVLSGLVSDARNGVGAMQALLNAVNRLFDRLADKAVDGLVDTLFGKSGGTSGGLLSGLFGGSTGGIDVGLSFLKFADGGHVTGPGSSRSDSIPAMLSNGEFVINAQATGKHRALLEAINAGEVARFADGGFVGSGVTMPKGAASPGAGNVVTIAPSITVNAAGGTPQQNADLAQQTAKAAEGMIRGLVNKELMAQTRPGNMLNQ